MPAPATTTLRLLVTVKAYPSVSTKYNELVCCAGITEARQWVRLYPVPYRDLPNHTQFQKYDIVEVICDRREAHKDNRPEADDYARGIRADTRCKKRQVQPCDGPQIGPQP